MGVKIISTGSHVPERILTNQELEKMVDTSDEWISERTGIKLRHIAGVGETPSTMGVKAARNALEMAGVSGESIDLIVFATVTPDMQFPSTACLVQKELKAVGAACFDLQAACSGFLYSLEVATAMMSHNKRFKKALIIGGEKLSAFTDWTDRNTCVLFGDGAGAAVLEKSKDHKNSLVASILGADGNCSDILKIPGGGSLAPLTHEGIDQKMHCIKMEGKEVFKLAVNAMVHSCRDALTLAKLTSNDIAWLVPHQANMRILSAVGTRLGIPEDRVYVNVDRYGNTSAASIPIALDEMLRGGKIKPKDKVLFTAFGGGMTWGASVVRF